MGYSGSTTAYALLGLLNVRPWTTYELAKQVQRSLHWFWPQAERRLYQVPKMLAEAGLATATKETTGRRPRTLYSITDAGRAELVRWLSEAPEPRVEEFAAMVKVFFADAGTLDQLLATLDAIEDEARERVATLADLVRQSVDQPAFPARLHVGAIALRLQLEHELTVLDWVRWAREQATQWNSTTDPGAWRAEESLRELLDRATRAVEPAGVR